MRLKILLPHLVGFVLTVSAGLFVAIGLAADIPEHKRFIVTPGMSPDYLQAQENLGISHGAIQESYASAVTNLAEAVLARELGAFSDAEQRRASFDGFSVWVARGDDGFLVLMVDDKTTFVGASKNKLGAHFSSLLATFEFQSVVIESIAEERVEVSSNRWQLGLLAAAGAGFVYAVIVLLVQALRPLSRLRMTQ